MDKARMILVRTPVWSGLKPLPEKWAEQSMVEKKEPIEDTNAKTHVRTGTLLEPSSRAQFV